MKIYQLNINNNNDLFYNYYEIIYSGSYDNTPIIKSFGVTNKTNAHKIESSRILGFRIL